ncbi:terpene synthase family protein [Chitinophaga arvensicola]|uniref:Terpene synthase n=1 Tax=Chitinophaga arvensicola TaxID=29529 RepID=A0A1I0PFM7_9BACT|nr:hypothetical protein [Chitinophaga arvensicola]SEW13199.1 hypothetical protein SAMN04488122_0759 [Chitinophaga arvensicola]
MPPTLTLPPWKKKISEWLQEDYYFLPEKVKKKYLTTGVGHAGGCMFPHANEEQLTAICRFFLWAFTIDDSFEFSTVAELQTIRKKAFTHLRGVVPGPVDPLYKHLPVLREELLRLSSLEWLNRFNASLDIYFDGIQQELPFRKNLVFPTWNQFLDIREKAVNVYPLVNFAELITGIVLPDEVVLHPALQEIGKLTCRILSWSNDYFSAHMEKGNDVLNLVLMIEHSEMCSFEEAYKRAVDFHNRDLARYCFLLETLPDFGRYSLAVRAYTENLSLMIHGYLNWTLTLTKRYKVDTAGHPSSELKNGQLSSNV